MVIPPIHLVHDPLADFFGVGGDDDHLLLVVKAHHEHVGGLKRYKEQDHTVQHRGESQEYHSGQHDAGVKQEDWVVLTEML